MPKPLTVERVREALDYDFDTGVFVWRLSPSRKIRVGQIAGCPDDKGYTLIGLDGGHYFAHRLAWFWVFGEWPTNKIDHRNGDGCDNRLGNLRDASDAINSQNQRRPRKGNASGLLGVSWDRVRERWTAHISVAGVQKNLGRFKGENEAYAVYLDAKRRLHEGCTL